MVVNTPYLLKGAWNIAWGWLDKFVQQKIIVTGDPKTELAKWVNEDDLEKKYGGKKEDLTSFWPV